MPDTGSVLVARPEPGAGAMVAALQAAGVAAVACPALTIEPVPCPPLPAGRAYHATVVTSANAVRHGAVLLADPAALGAVLAVGSATAEALAEFGLAATVPADQRSEGLLALPALAGAKGRHVLLLGGVGGRNLLASGLEAQGVVVDHRWVYRRVPQPTLAADLAAAVQAAPPAWVVASSAEVAQALAAAWPGGASQCGARLLVPSARVAEVARSAGFRRVENVDGAGTAPVLAAVAG